MTVNRTTLLDLPLPVTGTESGTWGDTTNNGLSQYMDIAIAGMTSLTSANFPAGALTIANTQGDSSATNIAAGSAQYGAIKVSSLATNSTITAPSSNRRYVIINADATYNLIIKASGQTGVTVVPGEKALVAFNGTDYVKVGGAAGGSTTQIQFNNAGVFGGSANLTWDGTNVQIGAAGALRLADTDSSNYVAFKSPGTVASNVTWTLPSADGTNGQALTTNGSGTLAFSSVTTSPGGSNTQVQYNNAGAFAGSSNLTFDGTNLTVGGTATATKLIPTGNVTAGNGMYLPTTNTLAFSTDGSERMRIDSSGNVGIGTTSPNTVGYGGSVLGIYGASNTGGNIWLTSDTTSSGNRAGRIGFGTEGNSSNKEIARVWSTAAGSTAGNLGGDLLFNTKADGGSLTERMRINADGTIKTGSTISVGGATPSTSGCGITFPATQSASSDANTLDDYEEGTWTPSQGTFDTWTSPTFSATYTKIGRQVTINLVQTGGTIGWSAQDFMSGLPFTTAYAACGYATDDGPASDNGPVLIWTAGPRAYFQTTNASETALVFTATYFV